ncbi:MAG: tetratricopeptide repeat protein, partial [Balneolales bacterium]
MKLQLARAQALLNQKKTKPDLVIKVLRPLVKKKNAPWPVFHYLGVAFMQKNNYKTALEFLSESVKRGADEPETDHSISICHFSLGAFDKAVDFEKKALERKDNFFNGWLHLGMIYRAQANLNEAIRCLKKANQIDPENVTVACQIADIFKAQGNPIKALELYNFVLKREPSHIAAQISKAEILKKQRKFAEAENCLYTVLKEDPRHLTARVGLAELYKYQGNYKKAIELYQRLVDEYPKSYVRNNYALCQQDLGLFDESEANYLKALKNQPQILESLSNYLMGLHYNPERTKEEIFEAHKLWDQHYAPEERPQRPVPLRKEKNKKLRIGFISGGFIRHPVGWMIVKGLENLPKSQFEIYCYSTYSARDFITHRIIKTADQWRPVADYKNEVLSEMVLEDEIDILVELSGHSADNRLKTVALEPAPVVVKWVGGLFNTTGLESIDYLITDWHETPKGEEPYYTEKLVRMPDDYICYTPPEYAPEVKPLPAKENGIITFGCFNNPTKVNNDILDQWAVIMGRVSGSRIFLKSKQYDTEALRKRIIEKMESCGIDENRLLFEGHSRHEELLACYNQVDIALDPWPYSGGLTTCEALWMGVPVITIPGPTFAGRHSTTHL